MRFGAFMGTIASNNVITVGLSNKATAGRNRN